MVCLNPADPRSGRAILFNDFKSKSHLTTLLE
jgi:hypothetical protein